MDVKEHFYSDNPAKGPEDAQTTLAGVNYLFLGNGLIQAAVQVDTSKKGTPLGLLLMHPEKFGPKSKSLTSDPVSGLKQTVLCILSESKVYLPHPAQLQAGWLREEGIPQVEVTWKSSPFLVKEVFYCPDRSTPRLLREVTVQNLSKAKHQIILKTGIKKQLLKIPAHLAPREKKIFIFEYEIKEDDLNHSAEVKSIEKFSISSDARAFWKNTNDCRFHSRLLDHFFQASKFQLQANIAQSGKMDGGIWQYNLEWVRDQAMVSQALTLLGQFEMARTILELILTHFVTEEGATFDSSRLRPYEECEFDQNGVLLEALKTDVDWSGNKNILVEHWPKIRAVADFPLKEVFHHSPSGLLHNQREFWERHSVHGIQDGIELAYQLFVSIGLSAAASLARLLKKGEEARRWESAASTIQHAMLSNKKFGLVHSGHFIKRRTITGDIQAEISALPNSNLPDSVPLFEKRPHHLNPDTSTALPIAKEFINPKSSLASKTLEEIEQLWNQRWEGGGYGRYHVSSEPDSPGPWPFPSLFVARAYFEAGQHEKVWRILNWLNTVPGAKAGTWLEFYGPRPIPPYPQIGIVPWTWAELTFFFIHHILGVRPSWDKLRLRPCLLQGLKEIQASIRLRDFRSNLSIEKQKTKEKVGFLIDAKFYPYEEKDPIISMPNRDLEIKIILPQDY